jgi:hypothetical protein
MSNDAVPLWKTVACRYCDFRAWVSHFDFIDAQIVIIYVGACLSETLINHSIHSLFHEMTKL